MTPLLTAIGGGFRYDFDVARVRQPAGDSDLNRVFVISFPDRAARERYFADPVYKEIRARLFEPAVARMAVLAEYSV
ncbi:MAG: DUF1330 domain-containing protein [Acidobacteria bacterium]|nr:DUF1330 domain-containing protein [Acidobacteriota bacterium]